ncbi:hypothetical protein NliqN6_3591 [Naganishia liquefaciens]|uniref:WSC domain-containing protein n=1 Tax=Naganishia liquefaciens TaxID=104408 RepID=A0A8H3YF40_9TREE|nr:hypothetical protein NliqN6_3591 [Naganishia liquefaciens]
MKTAAITIFTFATVLAHANAAPANSQEHSIAARATRSSAGWYSYGCYADCYADDSHQDGMGRRLPYQAYSNNPNSTPDTCIAACQGVGYAYAGLQFGQECWCGNGAYSEATLGPNKPASECSTFCSSGAKCGGPCRNNIWSSSPKPDAPQS